MARNPSKILTATELKEQKTTFKAELAKAVDNEKVAKKALTAARTEHDDAVKASAKALAEATKKHEAAVKAAAKTLSGKNKEATKLLEGAKKANIKAKTALESLAKPATPQEPVTA